MKKCIFAGTFDPFTVGHYDTVSACLSLFDEVVVAVAVNRQKTCMFTSLQRREMAEAVFASQPRVRVIEWSGTIAELLAREGTPFYVRGVRNALDFEYETADLYAGRDIDPGIKALFIPCEQAHRHISSTLVKNCIAFGTPYEKYVPAAVAEYIAKRG